MPPLPPSSSPSESWSSSPPPADDAPLDDSPSPATAIPSVEASEALEAHLSVNAAAQVLSSIAPRPDRRHNRANLFPAFNSSAFDIYATPTTLYGTSPLASRTRSLPPRSIKAGQSNDGAGHVSEAMVITRSQARHAPEASRNAVSAFSPNAPGVSGEELPMQSTDEEIGADGAGSLNQPSSHAGKMPSPLPLEDSEYSLARKARRRRLRRGLRRQHTDHTGSESDRPPIRRGRTRDAARRPRPSSPRRPSIGRSNGTQTRISSRTVMRLSRTSREKSNRSPSPLAPPNLAEYRQHRWEESLKERSSYGPTKRRPRLKWTPKEEEAFVKYMSMFPQRYAEILRYDQSEEGDGVLGDRTQVGLKDKARVTAIMMIKSGKPVHQAFRNVVSKDSGEGRKLVELGYDW